MWKVPLVFCFYLKVCAFKLWCWRRLLRVPRTARRSNQSVLKEINPKYSLEGLMLKLKLQYFGHLMRSADSLEKPLMLGKIEGRRRRGYRGWDGWMASLTQDVSMSKLQEWWRTGKPGLLQSTGLQSQIRLSNWTMTTTALSDSSMKWIRVTFKFSAGKEK